MLRDEIRVLLDRGEWAEAEKLIDILVDKAEKWDKLPCKVTCRHQNCWECPIENEALDKLDLILKDKIVREKCIGIDQSPDIGVKFVVHPDFCPCHGTGYITRQATAEEVAETLERPTFWYLRFDGSYQFHLKSGAILYMSKEGK